MSIRARITAWFVLTIAALLIVTSLATYLVVRSRLDSQAVANAHTLAVAAAVSEADESHLDRLAGPDDQIWLTTASGRVVARSYRASAGTAVALAALLAHPPAGSTVARAPRPEGGTAIVLLGDHTRHDTLGALQRTIIVVGVAALAAAALLGSLLAARSLQPVNRLREQVDEIPGEDLDRRVAEGRADELGRLARAFNRLLARADRAAEEQQRFVADASHELKTPITALQGHARIVARAADRGDLEQARESALVVEQQTRRLAATLAELLSLAELGAGAPRHEPLRLDRVVADVCDELHAAAPTRLIDRELEPSTVIGDPGRLAELARVLLDNAMKYSPDREPISISVSGGDSPALSVRDRGPGLTPADRTRVYDRFFRGSAAPGIPGSGLGLAIARTICERHGATLALDDATGGGLRATVTFTGRGAGDLPRAPHPTLEA